MKFAVRRQSFAAIAGVVERQNARVVKFGDFAKFSDSDSEFESRESGGMNLAFLRMGLVGVLAAAMLFAAGGGGVALAGDVAAGEAKAEVCIACHGAGGNEPIADYPKLAGQSRKYLLQVMREYASGKRKNAVMNLQMEEKTSGLSDSDLQDLAAYFAAQPGDLR